MLKALKYQYVAKVGDRIRSYDFAERKDCYVEGVVTDIITTPYSAFVIVVDKDVWKNKAASTRLERYMNIPMEIDNDYDGRIVNCTKEEVEKTKIVIRNNQGNVGTILLQDGHFLCSIIAGYEVIITNENGTVEVHKGNLADVVQLKLLRKQLKEKLAIFNANGGRGVELADEIDELRSKIEDFEVDLAETE